MAVEQLPTAATGLSVDAIKTIMAGLTIAIGGFGPALAIGKMAGKAMEAIGRNPEAASKIQTSMILAIAIPIIELIFFCFFHAIYFVIYHAINISTPCC